MNKIVGELTEAGEKIVNCSVLLDLAKAFNPEIILSKLKGFKVKGSMFNLLQSYLNNRSHSTVINNVESEHETVNVGIPQGSCLGPLLLLVYINDIFS